MTTSDNGEDTAAARWNQAMSRWAIPQHILKAAPRRPFVFIPEMFTPPEPGSLEISLSNRRAVEALGEQGSVLDVGCGGGAAAFALVPPADEVIGNDRQSDMLELFIEVARSRGVTASTYAGSWPEVADEVPAADVVVCHNVMYNVTDIVPFVAALHSHARRRVVIEMTHKHPQDNRRGLWQHFWNLERPHEPTASLAVEAITEAGFSPIAEESVIPPGRFSRKPRHMDAAYWCRQLCLPPERKTEVEALVADLSFPQERVTIWWDV